MPTKGAQGDGENNAANKQTNGGPVFYNITKWIQENSKFFLPPVCNKMMHKAGQMKTFYVGGPNQRKDYHIEEGEEMFFMVKGDMCLKILEKGVHKDIHIKQGEIFLLPPHIPHSPQREAETVGLVIERERDPNEMDGLRYFIEKDGRKTKESLFEKWFHCDDLGTQLGPIIKEYFASEQHKTGRPIPGTIPENPPITVDEERSVEAPYSLQEWLDKNKDEIEEKGVKNLFGDGYQFQIDMFGPGTNEGGHDTAETWIWQLDGTSEVTVGDKTSNLTASDSLLIPAGCKYSSTRKATGARALICFQDPARKKK